MHDAFRRFVCLLFALICLLSLLSVSSADAEDYTDQVQSKASVIVYSDGEWRPIELMRGDVPLSLLASPENGEIPQFTLTEEFACQLILEAPFSKCQNSCLIYRQDGDRLIPEDGDYSWDRLDEGDYLIVISYQYEQSGQTYSGLAPFRLQVPEQSDPPSSPDPSSRPWIFDCITVSGFADGEWQPAHNATRSGHDKNIMFDDLLAFGMSIEESAEYYGSLIPQFVLTDEFVCRVTADTPFVESKDSIRIYRLNGSELTYLDGVSDWSTLKKGRYLIDVECYISKKDSGFSISSSSFSGARLFWLLIGVSPTPASASVPGFVPVLLIGLWSVNAVLLVLLIRKKKK